MTSGTESWLVKTLETTDHHADNVTWTEETDRET